MSEFTEACRNAADHFADTEIQREVFTRIICEELHPIVAALRAQLAEMRGVLREAKADLETWHEEACTRYEFSGDVKTCACEGCSTCETLDHINTALGRPECAADTTGEER